ncbi:kinase-like protein [Dothidotthia symphoricarpi CBS 119687]|uniref:Kinase-like protein n=1 Tax=Dothidotthia symphoricarpi CBS 119687 TaxID=1392245 RepID=A0A6A6AUX0_9PLEO|nr:kinase-like protein [Dothidotthia symphoricarpi CBS 119687]KAF2134667.1 kinase-like protein [Dothidotthia symphoricarpi CBS 119687]
MISATKPQLRMFSKQRFYRGLNRSFRGNGWSIIWDACITTANFISRAFVKTSSQKETLDLLKHEHGCYMNPAIRSSQNIRAMYDAIDVHGSFASKRPYCLAFEWMDCTLKDVCSISHRLDSVLHQSIARAILGALDTLKSQRLVHTDIKNDNILISGLDGSSPVVKLGDLGLVRSEGFNEYPVQPFAMRAPEVWSGIGCFPCSDVWAFAVALFDWISPCTFGINDMPDGHWPQPWAMAKLLRIFPGSVTIHATDPNYQGYFRIAKLIEKSGYGDSTDSKCFETLSFGEELKKLDIPPALANFFRYLLQVDSKQRPTAIDALKSQQFHYLGGKN